MSGTSEFEELLADVHAWHERVFGGPCSPYRTVIKLLEESAEVFAAIRYGNIELPGNHAALSNELVDVGLVLLNLVAATIRPEDGEDFLEGIRNKMREVEHDRDQPRRDRERGI